MRWDAKDAHQNSQKMTECGIVGGMILFRMANKIFIPDTNGEFSPLVHAEPLAEMASTPSPDIGAAFVHMILTFVVIIVLLFGTYWFVRRLIQNRLQKGVGNQSIQILEKRMLSPKTMLYLIEVEKKKILVAESHLEIKRLESFTEDLSP
jgi:flagellar biogenesis protein FliO